MNSRTVLVRVASPMDSVDSKLNSLLPRRGLSGAALLLFPLRVFLGFGWIRAGVEKILDPQWWDGTTLDLWLAANRDAAIAVTPVLTDAVFEPYAMPIAIVVALVQPLIGLALLLARRLRWALWLGIVLNVIFITFGVILPSAFYLLIEIALLTAVNTGMIGNDPRRVRVGLIAAWGIVALAAVPFITTLRPEEVNGDPAIVLATICGLAAATEFLRLPERSPA